MKNHRKLRISTYAKLIEKTTVWVGKLIDSGKLDIVKIDNTIFIKLYDDDLIKKYDEYMIKKYDELTKHC